MVPRLLAFPAPTALPHPRLAALLESPLVKDRGAGSMQRQLHERLKRAILDGSLAPGSRLPGSRALAEALAISRNTVTATYEHLAAEGYVQPDRQGTRVTELSSPARARAGPGRCVPCTPAHPPRRAPREDQAQRLPRRTGRGPAPRRARAVALSLAAWRRALDRAIRGAGPAALGYGDPLGEPRCARPSRGTCRWRAACAASRARSSSPRARRRPSRCACGCCRTPATPAGSKTRATAASRPPCTRATCACCRCASMPRACAPARKTGAGTRPGWSTPRPRTSTRPARC
jgi:hypothetical protein